MVSVDRMLWRQPVRLLEQQSVSFRELRGLQRGIHHYVRSATDLSGVPGVSGHHRLSKPLAADERR